MQAPYCRLELLCTALLLSFLPAPAAPARASVAGSVRESTGAPVALARVTLVQRENGTRREVVAGADGSFTAAGLPAGSYTVIVQLPSGGAAARLTVRLGENQRAVLPVILLSADVTARADTLLRLPLNGRNYLDVLRSISDVTPGEEGGNIEGYGPYGLHGNTSVNSFGQRGQDNNFLLDGASNDDSWIRGTVLVPSLDAIETVRLFEGFIPARYGHATGAAISVQTKSGSNQFHATLFDYAQNSALDARNFFDPAQKPGLVQNQFGGNLGGPVHGHGWFFFLDAESLQGRQGRTVISTVPTAAQKSGNFGSLPIYDPQSITAITPIDFARQPFPGNQIPRSHIPQAARNLIALYPDPNLPGTADNYRFASNTVRGADRADLRSDAALSERSKIFARLSYARLNQDSGGALPADAGSDISQQADDATTRETSWSAAAAHTLTLRPSLINEFQVALSQTNLNAYSNDSGVNAPAALGIPGLTSDGLPSVIPTGYASLGAAGAVPFDVRTTSYQAGDTVHWTTARHNWEFGVQAIRRHEDGDASDWTSRGVFLFTPDYTSQVGVAQTGNAIASLLTGYPSEVRRDVQMAPYQLRGWEMDAFAQDEIRIGRRLVIDAGVRYSMYPPLTEAADRLVNFNFDMPAPALNQFAGQGGVSPSGDVGYNKRAFAPRIGFALDLSGNGSTLLRGGFSTIYDAGAYSAEGILARNPPFASRLDYFNGSLQLGTSLAAGLPAPQSLSLLDAASLNSVHGSIYAIERQRYTPYSDQWGLYLEQRLQKGLALELGGASSMGIHLPVIYDINQPYPTPTPYPLRRYPFDPYLSRIEYLGFAGGSTYYAGQAKLTGTIEGGILLLVCYRFAKALDDATAPETGQDSRPDGYQYIYDPRGARSPSPFDITQRLVWTASYDLPLRHPSSVLQTALANWRASSVVTLQTGAPFTPQLALNGLNNGGFQLPNRVGSGSLPSNQRSYLHWFNTSIDPSDPNHAFQTPVLYQYGDSGYDILRGPGLATLDAALARTFLFTGSLHLETRVEAFNLLNRTNLALPNRILGVASSGVISHTSTLSRQIQLAVRAEW